MLHNGTKTFFNVPSFFSPKGVSLCVLYLVLWKFKWNYVRENMKKWKEILVDIKGGKDDDCDERMKNKKGKSKYFYLWHWSNIGKGREKEGMNKSNWNELMPSSLLVLLSLNKLSCSKLSSFYVYAFYYWWHITFIYFSPFLLYVNYLWEPTVAYLLFSLILLLVCFLLRRFYGLRDVVGRFGEIWGMWSEFLVH